MLFPDGVEDATEKEAFPKVIWPGISDLIESDDRYNEEPTEDDRFDERWARRFE